MSSISERISQRSDSAPPADDDFVARHVGDSIQVKPVPVAALRRFGPRPLRVLLFGGGPLVGWGLTDHSLGLAGHVADGLAAAARRGVEMDVVADAVPVRRTAIQGIRGLRLWRYDLIVVVLGQPSTQASVYDVGYWTSELVRSLLVDGNPAAALAVYDSSLTAPSSRPVWMRNQVRLSQTQHDAAELACLRTGGRVRFGVLGSPVRFPPDGLPFHSTQFEEWAEQIVHRLVQQLDELHRADPPPPPQPPRPDDERFRQRALEALRIGRDANPRLERLVIRARDRYCAAGAAINIIDRDQQWSRAAVPVPLDMPREHAYCSYSIQVDGSTLINDSRLDGRLAGNPLVEQIRFYAAHPIRSWDGYRIGALCVYGPEPRAMRSSELAPLRELAGLVEQELWSNALKPHAPDY